jgi:hypothetical protein
MGLSKNWRKFLELFNSRGVDYVIVGATPSRLAWATALHRRSWYFGAIHA